MSMRRRPKRLLAKRQVDGSLGYGGQDGMTGRMDEGMDRVDGMDEE